MYLFLSMSISFFILLAVGSAQSMRHRPIENPERPVEFLFNWVAETIVNQGEMNKLLLSLYSSENCPPSFSNYYRRSDKPNASVKTTELLKLLESGLGAELPKLLKVHTFNLGFHTNVSKDIKKILDDIPALESTPRKSTQQKTRQISIKPKVPVRKAEVRYNPDFDSDSATCPDVYKVGHDTWMSETGAFTIGGLPSNIRVVQQTGDPEKAEWTRQLTDEEAEKKGLVNFMPLVHSHNESDKKYDAPEAD